VTHEGPSGSSIFGRVQLPVFRSLTGYHRAWLGDDVVAGLTVWVVLELS